MNIYTLKVQWKEGELNQNTYVVENDKCCILIDAGVSYSKIKSITNKPIKAIFLTHTHFDHIKYIEEYDNKDIKIYGSIDAEKSMQDINLNASYLVNPKSYKISNINKLKDNEIVNIDGINIKCIYTPGHSTDSVCYLIDDMLFSGDTLFSVAIGRTDFVDSSDIEMINSLSKLNNLHYKDLYPGHGRVSNKDEQNLNIKLWLEKLKRR